MKSSLTKNFCYLMKLTHNCLKKKLVNSYERSVLQLLTVLQRNSKSLLNTFKFNEKTHSTMKQKSNLPLYAEHLHF